jgi:hypothetical protein
VFSTTFDVTDTAQDFTLRYDFGPVTSELGIHGVPFHASLNFRRLDGSAVGIPVVPGLDTDLSSDPDANAPVRVTDTKAGSLAPGHYVLDFDMQGFSVDFNHSYGAAYDIALGLRDAGPGPTPNPVPLPPAAWAALTTVTGLGALNRLRRRR